MQVAHDALDQAPVKSTRSHAPSTLLLAMIYGVVLLALPFALLFAQATSVPVNNGTERHAAHCTPTLRTLGHCC